MSAVFLAGAVTVGGLWAIASGLWPRREPLSVILGRVGTAQPEVVTRDNLDSRLGLWARRLQPLDRAVHRLQTDFRVLRKDPNEQAAQMMTCAAVGLLWGPCVTAGLLLMDIRVPWIVPVWLGLIGGLLGAVVPYKQLQQQAARRRADFSHALGAFCDVVSTCLAGGQTTKQAIDHAAAAGDGWAFSELRVALHNGYIDGIHPWQALERLGVETGLEELSELAAALSLAGEEGAAVREIVRAKARVIRERITAAIERRGAEATERMALPTIVLAVGFLVFWGYPALIAMSAI